MRTISLVEIGLLTILWFGVMVKIITTRRRNSHNQFTMCFGCHRKLNWLRKLLTTKPFCSRRCESKYYDFARRAGLERFDLVGTVHDDITRFAKNGQRGSAFVEQALWYATVGLAALTVIGFTNAPMMALFALVQSVLSTWFACPVGVQGC